MSKRWLTGCAVAFLGFATYQTELSGATATAVVQEQGIEGSWNARIYRGDPDRTRIQLSIWEDRGGGNSTMTLSRSAFDEMLELAEANGGDVRYELVRDAGTIVLEGRLRGSRGSGKIPDADADLAREARELGFGPLDLDDLMAMSIHGVTRDFVADMDDLGFGRMDFNDLLSFKIHGFDRMLRKRRVRR